MPQVSHVFLNRKFYPMPRYFFNVHHQRERPDTEGVVLPDAGAAWREASLYAGELLKEKNGNFFLPSQEWHLEVTDEQRKPVYLIRVTAENKLCAK